MHSSLFLDFLAGNQTYHCTPWGMPTRNIFGWQKPCYLLGEGYTKTFAELMETTDWDSYGTGRYEKCANCMAHCGYEPTAATATLAQPLQAFVASLRGPRVKGPMARGNRARCSSVRRNTSSLPRCSRSYRRSALPRPRGQASREDRERGVTPRTAIAVSIPVRISAGICNGSRAMLFSVAAKSI